SSSKVKGPACAPSAESGRLVSSTNGFHAFARWSYRSPISTSSGIWAHFRFRAATTASLLFSNTACSTPSRRQGAGSLAAGAASAAHAAGQGEQLGGAGRGGGIVDPQGQRRLVDGGHPGLRLAVEVP